MHPQFLSVGGLTNFGPIPDKGDERTAVQGRSAVAFLPPGAANVKECSLRGASYVKKLMPVQHFVNPTFLDPEFD